MKDAALRARIESAVKPFGIGALNYFAGISDMSFFGEASGDLRSRCSQHPDLGNELHHA